MTITAKYTGRMGCYFCFEVDGYDMYVCGDFGKMEEGNVYTIKIK